MRVTAHFSLSLNTASSFALSIPAPALLTQVDEHTMDLYVVTPSGETVASRVHAAVLICVKTAAILGAVLQQRAERLTLRFSIKGQKSRLHMAQNFCSPL